MTVLWSESTRQATRKTRFPNWSKPKLAFFIASFSLAAGMLVINLPGSGGDSHLSVRSQYHTSMHMAEMPGSMDADRPGTVVKPISCQKLPNMPGKSLTLALIEFPPNSYTPRHRHPGSVSAFVLKGMLRSQLAGEAVGTYGVGGTWFEPPDTVHLFAENASKTDPAEILAMFIADDDCGPLVIPD